ncbi:MAG: hypothetical protein QMD71_07350 [bacterium]|nr:hypothetical protein [bacterium]
MKKGAYLLAIFGIVALILGCEAQRVRQAVEGLKPEVQNLATKLDAAKGILGTVGDLEAKIAGKVEKAQIDELLGKISETKTSIADVLALEDKIGTLMDTLVILDRKATGKVKEDVSALSAKVGELSAGLGAFRAADMRLDNLKAKLEAMKEVPAPKKAIPAKPKIKKKVK